MILTKFGLAGTERIGTIGNAHVKSPFRRDNFGRADHDESGGMGDGSLSGVWEDHLGLDGVGLGAGPSVLGDHDISNSPSGTHFGKACSRLGITRLVFCEKIL